MIADDYFSKLPGKKLYALLKIVNILRLANLKNSNKIHCLFASLRTDVRKNSCRLVEGYPQDVPYRECSSCPSKNVHVEN